MKKLIKKILNKLARVAAEQFRSELVREIDVKMKSQVEEIIGQTTSVSSKTGQQILLNQYRGLAERGDVLPSFSDVNFRCYSQFEEDGILLYIFGLIGAKDKVAVEICAGDGVQCNTANLIINHGWQGFLFDGDERFVEQGKRFYAKHPDTFLNPPQFNQCWVTRENVNQIVSEAGISGDVDLLSLDIDGMDYWIWEQLDIIKPRVVVCETQNIIPPELSLTVPYDPEFIRVTPDYFGASLAAMTKLGNKKGYRLVGTHRYGFNAFYVRNDVGEKLLPEVSVESCVQDPYSKKARAERWPKVKEMNWMEV